MKYTNMSADCHLSRLWFPKDLFQSRLPANLRAKGPKVVETDKGTMWEWEGELQYPGADGKDFMKYAKSTFRSSRSKNAQIVEISEGKLPCHPDIMLSHLDMDGTYAAVFFTYETRKASFKDPELEKAFWQAHNDWVMEISAADPDRLIVLPTLPTSYPEFCVQELNRMAKKGAKAVEFPVFDVAEPIYEEIWEPFWAAAEETDTVICSHVGDKKGVLRPPFRRGARLAHYPQAPKSIGPSLAQLIFSGVFERHPRLRYCFAETRLGWIPFDIQWMDRTVKQRYLDAEEQQSDIKLSLLPSEYIKRQIIFTFEEDYLGAKMLSDPEFYIQDSAVWGSDYPHDQGTWPNSEKKLDEIFNGIDAKIRQTVVWDRTAAFFKIKGPDARQ